MNDAVVGVILDQFPSHCQERWKMSKIVSMGEIVVRSLVGFSTGNGLGLGFCWSRIARTCAAVSGSLRIARRD